MDRIDCVVVGAGVVGLAIARALALAGREVVVLEATEAIGTQTSSRNSEVIHAGLYYPAGSLKARTCVAGREALYAYCDAHRVAYRRCGKLIVATQPDEVAQLDAIVARARANGVHDLQRLSGDEARALEPALRCTQALLSPSTGIVDSHGLMLAYRGDAEAHGAMIAFGSPLVRARVVPGGLQIETGGDAPLVLHTRLLVNSAGLDAVRVACAIDGLARAHVPPAYLCKGNYFALAARAPFSRLVYPVPASHGLGVHLTLDLAGQARFGPDVEWVDALDYRVDPRRGDAFDAAIRSYWPGLPEGALAPAYAGIRPKISGPGEPAADFVIQGPAVHGIAGLVNCFGIESPGLTASLALADEVLRALGAGR